MVMRTMVVGLAAALLTGTADGQVVFRSGVELVRFGVAVVGGQGSSVYGLTADDFEIYENGRRQAVTHFVPAGSVDESVPLHVGLLLDTSGSMTNDLQMARTAAIKFLNRLPRAEDMTLVDFDTEVRVAKYGQNDFPRLVERIRNRRPEGWTALYDALGVYLDGADGLEGDKILVIYTDGGDTRSIMSFNETLELLRASDVTVYAIGFLQNQSQFSRSDQRMRLQMIAQETAGQAFFPMSLKEIEAAYDQVLRDIRGRYILGYASSDHRTDGAWREVEIKVSASRGRDLKVRARKGYFAPYRTEASR